MLDHESDEKNHDIKLNMDEYLTHSKRGKAARPEEMAQIQEALTLLERRMARNIKAVAIAADEHDMAVAEENKFMAGKQVKTTQDISFDPVQLKALYKKLKIFYKNVGRELHTNSSAKRGNDEDREHHDEKAKKKKKKKKEKKKKEKDETTAKKKDDKVDKDGNAGAAREEEAIDSESKKRQDAKKDDSSNQR
jgi:hypothetical protein